MPALSRTQDQVQAALKAVEEAEATRVEKAEMLMEIAMGLQQKPKEATDLDAAVDLYETALRLLDEGSDLLAARVRARLGTALMAKPSEDVAPLLGARDAFEAALPVFREQGSRE